MTAKKRVEQPSDPLLEPPPHFERLASRIRELDAAVIVLLGWPGTGRRRVLAELGRLLGEEAAVLVRGRDVGRQLRGAQDREASWLLMEGGDAAIWTRVADRLRVGERLVVSARDVVSLAEKSGGAIAAVGHRELLLREEECAALARSRGAGAEAAREWSEWSDGWLVPLEIGLAATTRTVGASRLELPGLRDFLMYRVVHSLTVEEREALTAAAWELAEHPELDDRELRNRVSASDLVWRQLAEHRAWLIRDGDRLRPPRPLAEALLEWSGTAQTPARTRRRRRDGVRFRLRLLGPPEVHRVDGDGESQHLRWPFRRVLEVLALLAISEERSCSQTSLADAIWQQGEGGDWRRNLHPTVSHLRRILRGGSQQNVSTVRLRQGVYTLAPEVDWEIDAAGFVELTSDLSDPPLESLEEAWALYRGPFLEGFERPWIVDRRAELEKRYLRLLMTLGELYARGGRLTDAEDAYRALLVADPVREEVHLALMRLAARRGRPDLVRRQYQRLCGLLAEELGVQPMDATAREYQRLLGWSR